LLNKKEGDFKMNISLNTDQINTLKSRSRYWEEVARREESGRIFIDEMAYVLLNIGSKNVLSMIHYYVSAENSLEQKIC
jgi:hypothetical protein